MDEICGQVCHHSKGTSRCGDGRAIRDRSTLTCARSMRYRVVSSMSQFDTSSRILSSVRLVAFFAFSANDAGVVSLDRIKCSYRPSLQKSCATDSIITARETHVNTTSNEGARDPRKGHDRVQYRVQRVHRSQQNSSRTLTRATACLPSSCLGG